MAQSYALYLLANRATKAVVQTDQAHIDVLLDMDGIQELAGEGDVPRNRWLYSCALGWTQGDFAKALCELLEASDAGTIY